MSETALNFGPQWLRTLSDSGKNNLPPSNTADGSLVAPMKFAEFRYGREELLALYGQMSLEPSSKGCPSLNVNGLLYNHLILEVPQEPINLTAMTGEERRNWNRGVNSDVATRFYRKEAIESSLGSSIMLNPPIILSNSVGSSGAAHEPHRSRPERYERSRGVVEDDPAIGVSRSSRGFDRSWSDRGRGLESETDLHNGNVSPRKGYTRAPSDDWRKGSSDYEEDGWRTTNSRHYRWNNGTNASGGGWRGENPRKFGEHRDRESSTGNSKWRNERVASTASASNSSTSTRGSFRRKPNSLPEWAIEDSLDKGGSFDAAGKFRQPLLSDDKDENSETFEEEEDVEEEEEEVDVDDLPSILTQNTSISTEKNASKSSVDQDSLDVVAGSILAHLEDDEVEERAKVSHQPSHFPTLPHLQLPSPEQQWIYLDPQGNTQGPFSNKDMNDWFKLGYFPPDLILRRVEDSLFSSLAELTKSYGQIPFNLTSPSSSSAYDQQRAVLLLQQQQQQHQVQAQQQLHAQQLLQQHLHLMSSNVLERNSVDNIHSSLLPSSQRFISSSQFPPPPTSESLYPESYDPIKSLLTQLQFNESPKSSSSSPSSSSFPSHPQNPSPDQTLHSCPLESSSIWDVPGQQISSDVWKNEDKDSKKQQIQKLQQQHPPQQQLQINENEVEYPEEEFIKPKSSERRDKKLRRAEEKRKIRDTKKTLEVQRYIPGMEGSVRPIELPSHSQESLDIEQNLALLRIQEEQQLLLQQQQQQQQKLTASHQSPSLSHPKLAPWASKAPSNDLSLAEIQKNEAEREALKALREAQTKELEEAAAAAEAHETNLAQQANLSKLNWAQQQQTLNISSSSVKSLAEIQAEESRQEKAERERKNKKTRSKENVGSPWSSNISWANKIVNSFHQPTTTNPATTTTNNTPNSSLTTVRRIPSAQTTNTTNNSNTNTTANTAWTSNGFWEEPSSVSNGAQSKKKHKIAKEESKVAEIFKEKTKPQNTFEEWCTKALTTLNAQVDIPTFLAFLNDIESPFEVNDYVKNYIGEGKGPKNFAKEYLERRSKWKNSLKSSTYRMEDNLMAPAVAINPLSSEFQEMKNGGSGGGNNRTKSKKTKGAKAHKMDASHLLGFSVYSNRVNAGELDVPES